MEDLTIIMLTLNKLPKEWTSFHKETLLRAAEGKPIITISKEPMDWGINILQEEKVGDVLGVTNIYRQILIGAKMATTPFIAIAEDDTLYPAEHFRYRPPLGCVAYNMTRWAIFTWGKPFYFYKRRASNSVMVADRNEVIRVLEERFAKYPDFLPEACAKEVGTIGEKTNIINFNTHYPVLCFNHIYAVDRLERLRKKKPWVIQAYDIPYWGKATEIVKKFI